mmetsp:Transcript_4576/g.9839  ORF Transcript_4576/g.9839 Transcript_4576/m.9839 type:complete len:99 (+) Transcript_4576:576-872(+)
MMESEAVTAMIACLARGESAGAVGEAREESALRNAEAGEIEVCEAEASSRLGHGSLVAEGYPYEHCTHYAISSVTAATVNDTVGGHGDLGDHDCGRGH